MLHLTDTTFDMALTENSDILVMFYAPWCGHCKKMKPEMSSAAVKLTDLGLKGKLAGVDCTTSIVVV